jgi:probable F420-dependent oxidoreductase
LKVILEADPDRARAIARGALALYLSLPNYTNTWLRLGFTDDDLAHGGSDRLVDALTAWGTPERIRRRIADFHSAGADHVALQLLVEGQSRAELPRAGWRQLAEVVAG